MSRSMGPMLQGQVLGPHARKDRSGILPPEGWCQETSLNLAQTTAQSRKPKEIGLFSAGNTIGKKCKSLEGRGREGATEEGGERKNSTGRRGHATTNPGASERQGATHKGRQTRTERHSRLRRNNRTISCRSTVTSGKPFRSQVQHGPVEKSVGRQTTSQRGTQVSKPQSSEGTLKSWAEVARFGQLASWDRC